MSALDARRFIDAQDNVWEDVLEELHAGRKTSHWMWFVFPQLAGLGRSSMAARFAIGSAAEAAEYLAHPTLGPRLVECTELVQRIEGATIDDVFGDPDTLKFRSCMTLFARVAGPGSVFRAALDRWFAGEEDALTIQRLEGRH